MKPHLVDDDFVRAASILDCPVTRVKAVTKVEARSSGFDENDQPIVLFERHKFWAFTKGKYEDHPDICNPKSGGYTSNNTSEWIRLHKAMALDEKSAIKAASWGLFQVMGFNFNVCNYDSPEDFMHAMQQGEPEQLDAFVHFVKSEYNILYALQHGDPIAFAKGYNGPNYMVNKYDTKLKAAGF